MDAERAGAGSTVGDAPVVWSGRVVFAPGAEGGESGDAGVTLQATQVWAGPRLLFTSHPRQAATFCLACARAS